MRQPRTPSPVVLLAVITSANLVALAPAPAVAAATVAADIVLLDSDGTFDPTTALIMGGTGTPQPDQSFLDALDTMYIAPHHWNPDLVSFFTPENGLFYGDMSSEDSVAQGVDLLHTALTTPPADGGHLGEDVLVFGVSQSAVISGLEMQQLADAPPAGLGDLHFALLGDPTSPAGGMFIRFPGVTPWSTPTPTDLFPTDSYSGEFDGVSDFPRYPLNLLSTANALAGIMTVHIAYQGMTADQVTDATLLGQDGLTNFYMIPTEQLPILWPLYQLGPPGQVLGDTLDPLLRVFIDLGYGNLAHGELADPGGVAAGAAIGFLPKLDPLDVLGALQQALAQTVVNPINDLLGFAGLAPLGGDVTDVLQSLLGYDLTTLADQGLTSVLTALATTPGLDFLDPALLFDGTPLIDGAPLVEGVTGLLALLGM